MTLPSPPATPWPEQLPAIVEALLLAADTPLSLDRLQELVGEEFALQRRQLRAVLDVVAQRQHDRCSELVETASGYRLQLRAHYAPYVARLYPEKPVKMSRAALETLALIVYRQPITRGDIEEIRGVAVSSNIIRGLLERGWIREVGFREGPGRPALFATTPRFLDDFNLRSLDQLPPLPALKDSAALDQALQALTAPAVTPLTAPEA